MRTTHQKEVLTTGQVARICHVAPRTVSKWFDSGKLRGYRIPGSRDRRIPLPQLIAFMRVHGIPLDGIESGLCRVMVFDESIGVDLLDALRATGRYEVSSADGDFEAGVLAQQFLPHVVILDVDRDPNEAEVICSNIKSVPDLQAATVIATTADLSDARRSEILSRGFDACLAKPLSQADLTGAIEDATDLIH